MKNIKITTLQIFPGPESKGKTRLINRFEALSEFSQGTLVSLANDDDIFFIGDYKVIYVKMKNGIGLRSNLKLFFVVMREALLLKRIKGLDLVVCYDPLKVGLYGLFVKVFLRVKLLVEVNGEFNSPHLYRFRKGILMKIKKIVYPILKAFVLKHSDAIKMLFPDQLNEVKLKPSVITGCFFDYTPMPKGEYFANSEKVLLTMGFPMYIKGIDILILAFLDLLKKFPNWKLEIVGWFDEQELEKINQLSGGNRNVIVSKPIPFESVASKIDSAEIFVLASRTEAMGRVLLEAMARGKPRVAAKVGGIPTVVDNGVDGILFDPESKDSLVIALSQLMKSESLRQKYAESGLLRYEEEYSLTSFAGHTKSLYQKVCS